jgi:hypothetical protein
MPTFSQAGFENLKEEIELMFNKPLYPFSKHNRD